MLSIHKVISKGAGTRLSGALHYTSPKNVTVSMYVPRHDPDAGRALPADTRARIVASTIRPWTVTFTSAEAPIMAKLIKDGAEKLTSLCDQVVDAFVYWCMRLFTCVMRLFA